MIDYITKQKVKVMIHDQYGLYVDLTDYNDFNALEDELLEKYDMEYESMLELKNENENTIGYRMYFGSKYTSVFIQSVLDKINFNTEPDTIQPTSAPPGG